MFQYSIKRKESKKIFDLALSYQKLTSIFNF